MKVDVLVNGKVVLTNVVWGPTAMKRIEIALKSKTSHKVEIRKVPPKIAKPVVKPSRPILNKITTGEAIHVDVTEAQSRLFLAEHPLDCLVAPSYYVPVCTADWAYRHYYDPSVIDALKARFGKVEAWCDCEGTPFEAAEEMVKNLGLDGAWGQCESELQFENGYHAGARRMVGKVDALNGLQTSVVMVGGVLITNETYYNVQPDLIPDWKHANPGIGGNCIAVYASVREGAVYTPISEYLAKNRFVAHRDSVYAPGMTDQDWKDLP